ncbi:hypothetical protein HGRIS_000031 [Hohenbuehelia grisea]|uniref:Uncharacterized protein n=1 Tax=Hohenbuehelia grisea TaxID=104357 RepID=A0ABR3JQM8_9AGAR
MVLQSDAWMNLLAFLCTPSEFEGPLFRIPSTTLLAAPRRQKDHAERDAGDATPEAAEGAATLSVTPNGVSEYHCELMSADSTNPVDLNPIESLNSPNDLDTTKFLDLSYLVNNERLQSNRFNPRVVNNRLTALRPIKPSRWMTSLWWSLASSLSSPLKEKQKTFTCSLVGARYPAHQSYLDATDHPARHITVVSKSLPVLPAAATGNAKLIKSAMSLMMIYCGGRACLGRSECVCVAETARKL